ncbi:UDP-N-acetylmuramoylalanine--D-glutamate ligase [Rhodobacterales bacterium 52_120_T64]|nr:UDP-N-acetylmuramoylalanine--D-glutamate ligase [Rhodobacterales bacterium 52_120_T64]
MIPVRGYTGARVGVLGLGVSGLATAAALQAGGATPVCWDDSDVARAKAEDAGYEISDLTKGRSYEDLAALIVSPGIPHLYPEPHAAIQMAWESGVVVDNDVGLFFQSFALQEWDMFERYPRVVCVTGSNGKSTTSALLHHILEEAGIPTQLGGNIGIGSLGLEPARDGDVVVLELSSYQIELARALQPDVAVFLNLSPDHLDRHGGIGGYFAAKKRLFTQGGPERSVIGVDQSEGQFLASVMREGAGAADPVISISTARQMKGKSWSVFARKGFLVEWRKGRQVASIDLRNVAGLPGAHNHQNACAAYAVCRSLGLAPKQIEPHIRDYHGMRHRCQAVANTDGVKFVNDSKATNADAAGKALGAFSCIRWIAGGQAKEGGIAELAPLFHKVAKAYLIGEAAEMFAGQLGDTPYEISETLEAAVKAAKAEAEAGDTVLLAPACASFDQFENFEKRGEAFETLVRK